MGARQAVSRVNETDPSHIFSGPCLSLVTCLGNLPPGDARPDVLVLRDRAGAEEVLVRARHLQDVGGLVLLHNLKKYNAEKNFKTKDKKFYNSIIQLVPLTATLLKV